MVQWENQIWAGGQLKASAIVNEIPEAIKCRYQAGDAVADEDYRPAGAGAP